MLDYLYINRGNIIVGLLIAAIIVFAISKIIKDRKAGGGSCGCGCEGCPSAGLCHDEHHDKTE